ncbi:MAG: HypC/HybG/HupF family hydrogenase formation chaperone [Lachnospiraceae bacterium]|nr:HypC/HybG/HupF family hydrogenase formation chaperone [Lachnospiraceae bacterium]
MCVAMPGTVLEVRDRKAVVDFCGNRIEAQSGLVEVKPGDAVLVHAGCIIQVIAPGEADETFELFKLIEDLE